MNYLKKNRDNSLIFPFDIMNIIWEYADPFYKLEDDLKNANELLEEIMYKRMKKHIIKICINARLPVYYMLVHTSANGEITHILINCENLNDENLKYHMLNDTCGYRDFFLWKSKIAPHICGIHPHLHPFNTCFKMKEQLKIAFPNQKLDRLNRKQIFKKWRKL